MTDGPPESLLVPYCYRLRIIIDRYAILSSPHSHCITFFLSSLKLCFFVASADYLFLSCLKKEMK